MVALVQIKVKRYGRLFDVEGNIKNDLFEIRGLCIKPLNPKKSDKRETIYLPTEEIMTQITNAVWKLYNIKISDMKILNTGEIVHNMLEFVNVAGLYV